MTQQTPRSAGPSIAVFVIALASLAMLGRLVGCGLPNSATTPVDSSSTSAPSDRDPAELLRKMVAKYQAAGAYRDQGRLKLSVVREGRRTDQSWESSVVYERPGRLRVDAFNLHVASDVDSPRGFVARIDDAASNNVDNQVVAVAAPEKIKLDFLAADPILFAQLTGQIQRPPVQLELLLADEPLAMLFGKDAQLDMLSDEQVDGHSCHRVKANTSLGDFVFSIDAANHVLRRLEYPAKALLPELAGDPLVSQAELVAELNDATLSPDASTFEFTLNVPDDAKRVRAFVLPPELPSAELLGKPLPPFDFVSPGGEKVTPASLDGKISVLFWYAHHPVCEKPAQEFVSTIKKLGAAVQGVAVCTEPADVGDKAVAEQLAKWKIAAPTARDLKGFHSRLFQLSQLPAVTLIDDQGRFQWMSSGPAAVTDLPLAIERLQKGDDLAALALANHTALREQYEQLLQGGGQAVSSLAPASLPEKLKLTQQWSLEGLDSPGSAVALDDGRLFVVASSRMVWEVSATGEVVAKHELDLPENVAITALRAWSGKDKTYFAAFSPLESGVYVFDDQWERVLTYPSEESPLPIRDVQVADLDRNDEPELLVAFAELAGLHVVSLEGKRLWHNRNYAPLLSVAASHKIPKLGDVALLTGRGGILPVNEWKEFPPKVVSGWALAHLFTAKFDDATQAEYLGIGVDSQGDPCVVGIGAALEETWNYPLSGSGHQRPVDFVASGRLRESSRGEWVVGWGDGSIHIVSEDGAFDDHFNTGQEIRGLTVLRADDRPLLVVVTDKGVKCWEVAE